MEEFAEIVIINSRSYWDHEYSDKYTSIFRLLVSEKKTSSYKIFMVIYFLK